VGTLLYGLAVTPDGVWATDQLQTTVVRVDPSKVAGESIRGGG
jgi:streptogramin lyase